MAAALKDHYNTDCARLIANRIARVEPKFQSELFVEMVKRGIRGKEFLARQDVFSHALKCSLQCDYRTSLDVLSESLGPELAQDTGMFKYGYWLWPVGRYIENEAPHHPEHLDASLAFIGELTARFTGEFAVRPLLARWPKEALKVMLKWSVDPNVHRRRLSSEGVRIRLPWAKRLTVFLDHPDECSKLLTHLCQAPEKFVQKSVGNNINDLFKENPALANELIRKWKKSGLADAKATQWIIRHGMRNQ